MTETLPHISLADVAEREGYDGPWWMGHDFPERPPDQFVVWSWNCEGCMMHLIAAAAQDADTLTHEVVDDELTVSTASTTLEKARAWRAEQGMYPL